MFKTTTERRMGIDVATLVKNLWRMLQDSLILPTSEHLKEG